MIMRVSQGLQDRYHSRFQAIASLSWKDAKWLFTFQCSGSFWIAPSISAVFSGQLCNISVSVFVTLPKHALPSTSVAVLHLYSVVVLLSCCRLVQFCLLSVKGTFVQEELGCCTSNANQYNVYICWCIFNSKWYTFFCIFKIIVDN